MSKKPAPAPAEYHVDPAALTLRPDLQRICDAASAAPQWDTERDRMKPAAAPAGVTVQEAAKVLLAVTSLPEVYAACEGRSKVYKFQSILLALSEGRT